LNKNATPHTLSIVKIQFAIMQRKLINLNTKSVIILLVSLQLLFINILNDCRFTLIVQCLLLKKKKVAKIKQNAFYKTEQRF